jgi:hypothetical protein
LRDDDGWSKKSVIGRHLRQTTGSWRARLSPREACVVGVTIAFLLS